MRENTQNKDYRTLGFVLRRTNYGEADRILNIITPKGKISAIAKAARKEKSKLAGGIEMFSLTDLNIHQGQSEFAIITGAKMVKYYSNILKDFRKMELAAMILKKISAAADSSDSSDYFKIIEQTLTELNEDTNVDLIESWFWLNFSKTMGEEINLYRDDKGEKLSAEKRYTWRVDESAFCEDAQGEFGADEIKMLRLMITTNLKTVKKVKISNELVEKILSLAKIIAKR